jgi:hypothetical protein
MNWLQSKRPPERGRCLGFNGKMILPACLPIAYEHVRRSQQEKLNEAIIVVPIIDGWDSVGGGKIIGIVYSFLTNTQGK